MTSGTDERPALMTFPCDFVLKAVGDNEADFAEHVRALAQAQLPEQTDIAVTVRQSSGGRFSSVTLRFHVQDRATVDAIYYSLTASDRVQMAL